MAIKLSSAATFVAVCWLALDAANASMDDNVTDMSVSMLQHAVELRASDTTAAQAFKADARNVKFDEARDVARDSSNTDNSFALLRAEDVACQLTQEQISAVEAYVEALGARDLDGVVGLFAEGGMVVSTSQGLKAPFAFFSGFLPELAYAETEVRDIWCQVQRDPLQEGAPSKAGVTFSFLFAETPTGELEGGVYYDAITFKDSEISMVEMYENRFLK